MEAERTPLTALAGDRRTMGRQGQTEEISLLRGRVDTVRIVQLGISSAKLCLMRQRRSYFWTLGAFLVATALGLSGRASQSVVAGTDSVASSTLSKAYVESAALCEVLLTKFHGCIHALLTKPVAFEFHNVRIRSLAELIDVSSEVLYCPIQRRPPPSLS
jgi:hypothetical protein